MMWFKQGRARTIRESVRHADADVVSLGGRLPSLTSIAVVSFPVNQRSL